MCLVFHIYDSVKYKGYAGHFTYYSYAKSKKQSIIMTEVGIMVKSNENDSL